MDNIEGLEEDMREGKIVFEEPEEGLEALIKKGDYKASIKAIAQVNLEGEKEKYIAILKDLKKKEGLTKEAIRKDIQSHQRTNFTKDKSKGEKAVELTKEERKIAMKLLDDDEFFEKFLDTTEELGLVGEDAGKILLYLNLTSRKNDDPINCIVKGESSSGKSFLVGGVTQFFPEEDILEFTALSPKALFHRKERLKNKALIIYERHGAEEADYSIRTLQSEKKLIFSTTVKDPVTGEFEAKDIKVEGPIAYIETTTQSHIHQENETRCFELHMDESEAQTERIHKAQNRKHEIQALNREAILKPYRNAQRLLEYYPVWIPFIDLIQFPTNPLRVRRDRLRFLALIETCAFLFQHKRERKIINGKEFILADIKDYAIAYNLIGKILESVLKGLSPKVKKLIEIAKEFDGDEFERKDFTERLNWNEKTINNHIKDCTEWGYFEITQLGGPGRPYKYKLVKTEDTPIAILPPEELKTLTSSTSNVQKGTGRFKPLPVKDKLANDQFDQRKTGWG